DVTNPVIGLADRPVRFGRSRTELVLNMINFNQMDKDQIRLMMLQHMYEQTGIQPVPLHASGGLLHPGSMLLDRDPRFTKLREPFGSAILRPGVVTSHVGHSPMKIPRVPRRGPDDRSCGQS